MNKIINDNDQNNDQERRAKKAEYMREYRKRNLEYYQREKERLKNPEYRQKKAEYMREYYKNKDEYRQKKIEYEKQYQKKRYEEDEAFREHKKARQKNYASEYAKTHRAEATERQKKWLMTPAGKAYKEAYKIRRRELAALKRAAKLKNKGKNNQSDNEEDGDADDNLTNH